MIGRLESVDYGELSSGVSGFPMRMRVSVLIAASIFAAGFSLPVVPENADQDTSS